jgi:hypothetical protein
VVNRSGWNQPNAPRYHLTPPENKTNGSWWVGKPKEAFTAACVEEFPRMRASRFGAVNAILVEGSNAPTAGEQMRERKRQQGNGAYAAWQKASGLGV